ncbi:rod shape-determining protein [Helcococcus ovis]|uniref:Cell shape-determining protein MreB n=1 Tax=Helcococcus ovis TaxID=72026 RepID=A0A4R9C1E8_9FIRM|nr:rod shape-determining protein [Helcococcus ovis]TFF63896.1 rod shape-determining protein [Helcococcus ovis]TFF64595.1 rod shape-determining protein [Helcococcus ovis]TFF67889.1 rod shape-determining protein [Helcococcus ovis]WNZ01575.1 rod shape-determining protein [Helcococcus ovis]
MNFRKRIAIDLGTTSVLVFTRKDGVIINEPSVVAVDKFTNSVIAVGEEASKMLGRTPGNIIAVRPLKEGVINDYVSTEQMLKYFIKNAVGNTIIRPNVIICVPSGATQVQKRAVKQAGLKAGANEVYLIEEPLAAAIGAGIEIGETEGNLIIDIGGGTTDIAVISRGGIVVSDSIRFAGDSCDEAIMKYIRENKNLIIGEKTAERIKKEIVKISDEDGINVKGRNLFSGLPQEIIVYKEDIEIALSKVIEEIANGVQRVLSTTPPELVSDLYENGALLAGGGALILGIREKIEEKIKISVSIADSPVTAIVRGVGKSLNWMNQLSKIESSELELTRKLLENKESLRRY